MSHELNGCPAGALPYWFLAPSSRITSSRSCRSGKYRPVTARPTIGVSGCRFFQPPSNWRPVTSALSVCDLLLPGDDEWVAGVLVWWVSARVTAVARSTPYCKLPPVGQPTRSPTASRTPLRSSLSSSAPAPHPAPGAGHQRTARRPPTQGSWLRCERET